MADDDPRRTRREAPGREPTVREVPARSPTVREGNGTASGGADDGLVLLPSALRDDYDSLGELDTRWGGEASLLRARRRCDGAQAVVKIYNRGITLSEAVIKRLYEAKSAHVVQLYAAGESNGRWYEVQEYVRGGTLRDHTGGRSMGRSELDAVIRELSSAIAHLHEKQVLHRDLKPANVLVRSEHPLDLVISDFGLASMTEMSMRAVSKSRTPEYSAPELRLGVAGWPSDWWSFGMTIAELAGGRHPFAGLQESAIDYALLREPVPLAQLEDPEVLQLCRGLLVRDPEQRWGGTQVEQWLRGEAPPAPSDDTDGDGDGDGVSMFIFENRPFSDPAVLARAFCASWATAARMVAGPNQRDELIAWLRRFPTEGRLSRVLDAWAEAEPLPDKRLAQLLTVLEPRLGACPFPEFASTGGVTRLVDLTPDSLPGLADEVLAGGSTSSAATLLGVVYDQRILGVYAAVDGRLDQIEERWHDAAERALVLLGAAASGSQVPAADLRVPVRARALQIATDSDAARGLAQAAAVAARSADGLPQWFQNLTGLSRSAPADGNWRSCCSGPQRRNKPSANSERSEKPGSWSVTFSAANASVGLQRRPDGQLGACG